MTVSLEISNTVHCQLDEVVSSLPPLELTTEGHLTSDILDCVRAAAGKMPELTEAAAQTRHLLESPGYVVVQGLVPVNIEEEAGLLRAACFNVLLGSPFHMVQSIRLWEPLGVDFEADSFRSGGMGVNPLHIDGVNTSYPPDYLILLCRRPDPTGGGTNVIANLQSAIARLSETERAELQQPIFEEGQFYGIVGVGPELRPFAALQQHPSGYWRVRVSGKMLPVMPPGRPRDLVERLIEVLSEEQRRVPLAAGEALYVNQLYWAHGREPLGEQQHSVGEHRRRLFKQSFIRTQPLVETAS